ncbi:MAG TPA: hypothetical protein VFX36_02710 [Nitrospira sp.]|nr:hypothetical protein [Nitrospira sp.]
MRINPPGGGLPALRSFLGCVLLFSALGACATGQRMTYDQDDIRIGVETDPSVTRSKQPVANAHPAQVTSEELKTLLGVVRVSGWSGTIAGIFETPRPVPLLTEAQLNSHAAHFSEAFAQAGPNERVFFSFPKPDVHYSEDRTTGALFLRDRYLHVVVTDHSSVIHADTAGGDARDIRDTKGMKLWIAKPAGEATVPDAEEPRWAPFETVHISLNVKQALARQATPQAPVSREPSRTPTPAQQGSRQEMQDQIRELTDSNTELREQLDEQKAKMKDLSEDINRLRRELDQNKAGKPPARKTPTQ